MTEIQEFFTRLVYNISLIIPLGYAFGAGMVSTGNPCGFAMLPAYLGVSALAGAESILGGQPLASLSGNTVLLVFYKAK